MRKFLTIILVLVFMTGLGLIINAKIKSSADNAAYAKGSDFQKNASIEIPDPAIQSIHDITDKEKPVIALFYVDWCTYCRRFMPIFGEAAHEYSDKYNFAAIHCEKPENRKIAEEFGIYGFPSLFIIDYKIDYHFPVNGYAVQDTKSFKKELDKYLEVRKHFTN